MSSFYRKSLLLITFVILGFQIQVTLQQKVEAVTQLGIQPNNSSVQPIQDVIGVSAGDEHTCALTTSGGIKCWGGNIFGQLGDGTTTSKNTPVDVNGLASDIDAVSAGSYHTCALTKDGKIQCWGDNRFAQLGDETKTNSNIPVEVIGLNDTISAIAAGGTHTCALTVTGTVKCWGDNSNGQLGNNSTISSSSPVNVVGLDGGVTAISVGSDYSCAIIDSGGVKCWGIQVIIPDQQLNNIPYDSIPVAVAGLTADVIKISVGGSHNCALLKDGSVKCWGNNYYGQLGNNSTSPSTVAVNVLELPTTIIAVSAHGNHSCALTNTRNIKCWGGNQKGQLGDGTTDNSKIPVDVNGLGTNAIAISAGNNHTCAVTASLGVKCWGDDTKGQLGDGIARDKNSYVPVTVSGLNNGVVAVSDGGFHTCALTTSGGIKCWGDNTKGQLGDGTVGDKSAPVGVSGLSSGVIAISSGYFHTCVLTTSGGVKCWGDNTKGQLGDGTRVNRYTPVNVYGLSSNVVAISAGQSHTCALTTEGVKCWGWNNSGRLGNGTTDDTNIPVNVNGLNNDVIAINAGYAHTCALTTSEGIKCWGLNNKGQLGDGTTESKNVPISVSGLNDDVAATVGGGIHTCALSATGSVKCWGWNEFGQLGDGTAEDKHTPVSVYGLNSGVAAISASYSHTCALSTDGGIKCWGWNEFGQLGDDTTENKNIPVNVSETNTDGAAISTGRSHTCALTISGGVKCWGDNTYSQLGNGSALTPVDVVEGGSATPTPIPSTPTVTVTPVGPTATPTNCVSAASGNETPPICPLPNGNSDFNPATDSYNFDNLTTAVASWESFKIAFGADVVEKDGVPLPLAEQYYNAHKDVANGGMCFGISSTAALSHGRHVLVTDEINPLVSYVNINAIPPTLDSTVTYLAAWQFKVHFGEYDSIFDLGRQQPPLSSVLASVKSSIVSKMKTNPVAIYISGPDVTKDKNCAAHAIIPISYQDSGSLTEVQVYDPNHHETQRKLTIDSAANSWQYSMADQLVWGSNVACQRNNNQSFGLLDSIPLGSIVGTIPLPFSLPEEINLGLNAKLLGSSGNIAPILMPGFIPGVAPVVNYAIRDSNPVSLTIQHDGMSGGEVSFFGKLGARVIKSVPFVGTDQLYLSNSTLVMTTSVASERSLVFISQTSEVTQTKFVFDGITVAPGEPITTSMQTEKVSLQLSNSGMYTLTVLQVGSSNKVSYSIALPVHRGGATQNFSLDHDTENVILNIDFDSDGTTDETQTLSPHINNPIESRIYLPLVNR